MSVSLGRIDATGDAWTRQRIVALTGSVLLITVIAYEQIAVSAGMPTVARELHGLALYGVVFAIPLAATVLSMTIAGPWADARGPGAVIWTGTGLFAGGLVLAGFAPGMTVLIGGRTVQALGGGLVVVALYVLVARVFTPRQVPKVFVGNSVAWVAPALFGPGISAFLVTHGLWRWVFFGAALVAVPALIMLVPALRGLPRGRISAAPTRARPLPPAAGATARVRLPPAAGATARARLLPAAGATARVRLLPAGGAAAGACLMSLSADRPTLVTAGMILGGAALLAVSAPRLMPTGTYTGRRGLPAVIVTRGMLGAAFSGTDVYLPLALITVHGLTPGEAGWTLTAGAVSWTAAAWFSGRIHTDHARRRAARIGLVGLATGIALCLVAAAPGAPVFLMYLGWAIGGAGIGFGYSPLSVLLLGMSPAAEQGRNSSALQANETLSTAVVLAITAAVYSALHAAAPQVAFVAVLAVPLCVAMLGYVWSFRLIEGTSAQT